MINIIKGNFITSESSMLCHQVNCCGVMGSNKDFKKSTNVAAQLRLKYGDELYMPYLIACKKNKKIELGGKIQILRMSDNQLICNMFSQINYGYNKKKYTVLSLFKQCLLKIESYCHSHNIKDISMPKNIGCNRGGADWDTEIYPMLKEVFEDSDIILNIYYL